MKKQTVFLLTLCILSFVGHLALLPRMPDEIPIHWNFRGEVDNWAGKYTSLITALLPLIMLGLFHIIPRLDPRGKNYEKHQKAYQVFITAFILFLIAVTWVTNAAALGSPVPIERFIPVGCGILMIVVGNYMPQIRTNYTLGIKNPWTLESEWVWKKTHNMAGIVFCVMGLVMALNGFISTSWMAAVSTGVILLGVFGLELYSYLLYRKWKANL